MTPSEIAETFKAATPTAHDGKQAMKMWQLIVLQFSYTLERRDFHFDRQAFLRECGYRS